MILCSSSALTHCELCPRRCGVNRAQGERGRCKEGGTLRLARAALHMWEEPPISGTQGSGAIFFSGCPLKCIYCQNYEISSKHFGVEVSSARLTEIMLELEAQGAANINLVTATHWAHLLPEAIAWAKARGLRIPLVYNTSGYERIHAVRELSPYIDIWLSDFKYASSELARAFSQAGDYPVVAVAAIKEMYRATAERGGTSFDSQGLMIHGMLVRHLVLPAHIEDSYRVLDTIWEELGDIPISVMNQYTPNAAARSSSNAYPELARTLSHDEYERVLEHADDLGFSTMYWQEDGTASESFIPPFDASGVM